VRLVFGLGNPGHEYCSTRHNVGYDVVDFLARREGVLFEPARSLERYDGPSSFQHARLFEPDAMLVKPETFMNRSGTVVPPLCERAGVGPEECLVVLDDLDLPLGKLRFRPQGSSGGHNGLGSILHSLGTERVPRLRIGIGRAQTDAARHVLAPFTGEERDVIDRSVAEAAEAVFTWLRDGDVQARVARFHSREN
jgi:PTH1 family peptidyl-tRNA hydrolase